jgi:PAS domain S-box-containing protein
MRAGRSVDPLLQSIAKSSPDSIMLLGLDSRIEYISRTAPGLTEEQVLGTTVYEYVPESQHAMMRSCFERVRSSGEPDRYENVYTTPDGDLLLWEARVAPVMRGDAVGGFLVIASDVTEQRAATIDRDRFFQLSLDVMCVAGLDGYLKQINPAFENILGWTRAELLAAPFVEFVHPDDVEATLAALEKVGQGGVIQHFVNRYRARDGSYRTFEWHAILDPETQRVHALARDVTEDRAMQAQLLQSQKMQAIGQLAGGIAHDFNNLMLAVLANASFVREQVAGSPDLAESLEQIEAAGRRAAALTRQLLTLGRRRKLATEAVDVGELTRRTVDMLRRVIPENIELAVSVDPELPRVDGDPGQLEQVVLNLCLNARDAMAHGGTMRLSATTVEVGQDGSGVHAWVGPGRWARLEVADDGAGMSPEVRARVFEPFFSTKSVASGSGLGLATVYAIVEQHGGEVGVESELGQGTSFFVYLPAVVSPEAEAPRTSEASKDTTRGTETILVAEDEDLVRAVVARILRGRGYQVREAVDGLDAVCVFEEDPDTVDLVLLDVVMPRCDGPKAYAEMAKRRPDLPVLFTSGYAEGSGGRGSLPEGAQLLDKPYDEHELAERVRAVLDEVRVARDEA